MSKPVEVYEQYKFPRGTLVTWNDIGDPVSLRFPHKPTIVISGLVVSPIAFMGSVDGVNFELLRDQDGDIVRFVKPGTYTLNYQLCYLKPCHGDGFKGTIQLFIEG